MARIFPHLKIPLFTKFLASAPGALQNRITNSVKKNRLLQTRLLQTTSLVYSSRSADQIGTTRTPEVGNTVKSRIKLEEQELEIVCFEQTMKFNLTWLRDHCR